MDLHELLLHSRSYRRFHQQPLEEKTLVELLELTRLCPSASNRQPLKYLLAWRAEQNAKIFPHLRWAAALAPWPGPAEGERPPAYVLILRDNNITANFVIDHGLAAQTLTLAATGRGLAACIIGSIDRERIRADLALDGHLEILLVVAIGEPAEKIVLENVAGGDIRYWRDDAGVHHVPKRPLSEVLLP